MFSSANITLLGFLSNIEDATVGIMKNVQVALYQTGQNQQQTQGKKTNQARPAIRVPLNRIRSDPFGEVCSYLAPADICSLKAVNKFAHEAITKLSNIIWKQHCPHIYGSIDMQAETSYHLKFLSFRVRLLETRLEQLRSLRLQRSGIDEFLRSGGTGVLGMVADIAWVEDEKIAMTISRKRFMGMATMITTTESVITKFKSANRNLRSATSFMPHATAIRSGDSHISMFRQQIMAPGFLGYAVNLIKLRPQHEYLRYSVFWIVFKNLMIFDTFSNLIDYQSTLNFEEAEEFWGVCIEEYSGEAENVYPRLLTIPNETYDSTMNTTELIFRLEKEIRNTKHSYTVLRYT